MAGTKPRGKPKSRALVAGAAHGGKEKKGVTGGAGKRGDRRGGRHGPRLPTALRRQLDALGPGTSRGSDEDEEAESDDEGAHDVYEYEEGVPEEEAGKNGRYDAVEKYEYEFDSDASNAVTRHSLSSPLLSSRHGGFDVGCGINRELRE